MANWRFGAFPKLPYSTMQQLNLDWILDRIRRFLPDTGTKGQVLTRTKDGAAWVDPEAASGAVSSVNGKTGAVVLTASDVGALPSSYQAPVTSVNGMTGDVVISGGGAVDSVNGKTGAVVLTAADVGALPSSTVIPDSTSDLINDSGFVTAAQAAAAAPVQSVNGHTGDVSTPFRFTRLWTNTDPSSSFAPQTISLNLSGYDYVMVITNTIENFSSPVICPIGKGGRLTYADGYQEYRAFTVTETGITFRDALYVTPYGTSSSVVANQYLIPTFIFGIKE